MSLFEITYTIAIVIVLPVVVAISLIIGLSNTRLTEMGDFGTFIAVGITTTATVGLLAIGLTSHDTTKTTPIANHENGKLNMLGKQIGANDYQHNVIIGGREETVAAQRSITVYDSTGERIQAVTTLDERIIVGETIYDYVDVDVDWELFDEEVTSRNWANAVISRTTTKKLNITITLPDDYKSADNTWK